MQKFSSKKHPIHHLLTTILLLGGGLVAAAGLTSCENFLNGGDVRQEIEDAIAYNNAKEITVLLSAAEGTGSTLPSGNYTAKQGYGFEISFSENPAYSFVKWTAVLKEDSSTQVTEGVVFEDATSPVTKVKISNDTDSIKILPVCEKRIEVAESAPRYNSLGVSRDRSISVSFTKPLAESNFFFDESEIPSGAQTKSSAEGKIWAYVYENQTYLKNISITNIDDYSIAQHFTCPVIDGKLLTIAVDKTNPIEFNSGEIYKTVKVTLSKNITDTLGIKMNSAVSWNYQITESTDEKATVILGSDKGTVYLAGTRDYSIGQKITLSYTEDADYQFVKWEYDPSIIYVSDPAMISTTAIVQEKTTAEAPTQIKAVCAPRLRIAENGFSPVNDSANPTVCKNSSIIITFSQNLPKDEEGLKQLENITIAVGGSPVKSSFKAPVINENTVTFVADNSNMLDVPAGQTKTVSVSIPSDFFYKLEDGTKVTYGGNGITFDYKIDETTTQKASVTFSLTDDSGTISPAAGISKYSIGQEVPLTFTPKTGWKFISWSILKDNAPVAESKIKIADRNAAETKLIVYEALEGVTVKANAVQLLSVISTSPAFGTNSKDSAITILFNQNLDGECKNILDQIKITMDGVNVDSFYADRTLAEDKITIKNTSYLNVTGNETKTITVSIPATFYYTKNGLKEYLPQEKTFSYVINANTGVTTDIVYNAGSGQINNGALSGSYNIGSVINLEYVLADGYQFNGWEIKDINGQEVADTDIKIADKNALSTTMTICKYLTGVSVKANASEKLKVSSYTPTASSNNKDSSITITFNKTLSFASDSEKESLLNSIHVSVDGNNVDNNFTSRIAPDNTSTITLTNTKYLSVTDGLQKTVTVTVPTSFYCMDGSVKVNLPQEYSFNYVVNSESSAKANISFSASTSNAGTQIPAAGLASYSLDKDIPLSFTPADGYEFTGWTATYTNGASVETSKIRIEDASKTSTKLYVYESVSGVTVKANAYLVPVVESVKINGRIDYYTQSKFDCDSKIHVNFNKPIDTSTVDISSNGSITITKNEINGSHYEDYFEAEWSNSNKQLILSPKHEIKNLVPNDDDTFEFRITFNANSKQIKESEQKTLAAESGTFNSLVIDYKISGAQEKTPPTIKEIHLFSTSDTNDYFYKELTNAPFEQWSSVEVKRENGNALYQKGDYSRNHVSHLYITMKGYDKDSGLKEVKIKETYKQDTSGNPVTEQTYTKTYSVDDFQSEKDSEGNMVYDFNIEYSFASENPNDGLYLIEVSLVDMANNEKPAEYWVIKDTYNSLIRENLQIGFFGTSNREWMVTYVKTDYNQFPIGSFYINGDKFYTTFTSQRLFTLKVYEDNLNIITLFDNEDIGNSTDLKEKVLTALANVPRNPEKTKYFDLTIKDEAGVTGNLVFTIPKSTFISDIDRNFHLGIYDTTVYETLPSLMDSLDRLVYEIFYTYQATISSEPSELEYLCDNTTFYYKFKTLMQDKGNGIYNLYVSALPYPVYSAIGKPYVYYNNVNNTVPDISLPEFTLPQANAIEYPKSSGTAKFSIDVDFPNDEYIYSLLIGITSKVTGTKAFSSGKDIEIESGYDYDVYITVKDANGNLVAKSASKTLSLKAVDNIPPAQTDDNSNKGYIDCENYRYGQIPFDYDKDRTKLQMEKIECYYVPYSYGNRLSLTDLNNGSFEHRTIKISDNDRNNKYINIPVDGLEFGQYWLYFYEKDNSALQNEILFANKHWLNLFIDNELQPPEVFTDNGVYKIKISTPKKSESGYSTHVINIKSLEGSWKESVINQTMNVQSSQGSFDINYDNYKEKYLKITARFTGLLIASTGTWNSTYCKPIYIYTDYYKYLYDYEANHPGETAPIYCKSKSWVQTSNGWQVFADKPCFVHTRYCAKNLTASGDLSKEAAYEWEARAQETGIVYNDGTTATFSYTSENLVDVPSGAYYTTICHFADGTVLMSEVKQK